MTSACSSTIGRRFATGRPFITAVALVAFVVLALVEPAAATWSVVAVDEDTGEVGVAMASCGSAAALGDADKVLGPIVLVPGRGAGVLQGIVRPEAIAEMEMLLQGSSDSASAMVESLLAAEEDPALASVRQYGLAVLTASDHTAVYDGDLTDETSAVVESRTAVAVGVRTVDQAVANEALRAFSNAKVAGASLSDALVAGLEAGSSAGGDLDCEQQTALFAHLAVAHPTDEDGQIPSILLTVTVDDGDGQNPVTILSQAHARGDRGWINAGLDDPTLIPKWLILILGLLMAVAAIVVIRRGLGHV